MKYMFASGPPFDSIFWEQVRERLEKYHSATSTLDLFPEASKANDSSPQNWTSILENLDQQFEIETQEHPQILVVHGYAIPAILSWLVNFNRTEDFSALVLCNGPILKSDQALKLFDNTPMLIKRALYSSTFLKLFLSSSLGLRRLVINPYVMNHDIVVRVCESALNSKEKRRQQEMYLTMLNQQIPCSVPKSIPVHLCWGDQDLLYPTSGLLPLDTQKNIIRHDISGGQHLHPVERPWALADLLNTIGQALPKKNKASL
ncbi:MAG: hypothetical protein CMK59_14485 [Proteobacteria bacterium]|nr:hypothetical protein [Pseudomonadota bacterium]